MKWFFIIVLALSLLDECAPQPDRENPALRDVYATANARIDAMQTSIAKDQTAFAITPERTP
jgi:hypothetical protein